MGDNRKNETKNETNGDSVRAKEARTVGLLPGDLLDVDDVLPPVHVGDLALAALEGTPDNLNLVILPHGDGADLQGADKVNWPDSLAAGAHIGTTGRI